MPEIISGSDMRATPPSLRMSEGTRSSAMTAAAPADSAILACSGVTTSMITPPLSISARPDFTLKVATSLISVSSLAMEYGGDQVVQVQIADVRMCRLHIDCSLQRAEAVVIADCPGGELCRLLCFPLCGKQLPKASRLSRCRRAR